MTDSTPPSPPVGAVPRVPPGRNCDMVMKGGITSGVVYPLAIVELAKSFRLKNVGGTSAGAIAAAAAAAAELGRASGGYDRLAQLPDWLGATAPGTRVSNLFSLFQPQRHTKALFDIATAWLRAERLKAVALLFVTARYAWFWALMGVALGGGLVYLLNPIGADLRSLYGLLASVVVAVLIGLCLLIRWLIKTIGAQVPRNFYGLCTGMGEGNGPPALTEWLTGYLNELAGKSVDDSPLTFGELWWPRGEPEDVNDLNINLRLVTTCLSRRRPYTLPFDNWSGGPVETAFGFSPIEFRKLFPEHVVRWMEQHPRRTESEDHFGRAGLVPLPLPKDLPVVVAVRMSLSFPFLLSMVPLWSMELRGSQQNKLAPMRCWFTDGGLCSNFPVQLFDAPLPRWPTMVIATQDARPGEAAEARMPRRNAESGFGTGVWADPDEPWSYFERRGGIRRLLDWGMALFGAAQNWNDSVLAHMPGQRDRIATVTLAHGEGGLNLNMSPATISLLSERGRRAGEEFVRRFGDQASDEPMNWSNHRWIRMRSFLAARQETLRRAQRGCLETQGNDIPYPAWINQEKTPPSYQFDPQQQLAEASRILRELAETPLPPINSDTDQQRGAPRPNPSFQLRPRV